MVIRWKFRICVSNRKYSGQLENIFITRCQLRLQTYDIYKLYCCQLTRTLFLCHYFLESLTKHLWRKHLGKEVLSGKRVLSDFTLLFQHFSSMTIFCSVTDNIVLEIIFSTLIMNNILVWNCSQYCNKNFENHNGISVFIPSISSSWS